MSSQHLHQGSCPITKCVNAISLVKNKKEKCIEGNKVVIKSVIEPIKLDTVEPLESGDRKEEIKDRTNDESARSMKEELTGWETKAEVVVGRLDIKKDKKKPFILGTSFLTMAKAKIRFDKGTITLRCGKNKINFFKILKSPCSVEKKTRMT
nr:hypothetical protein [Tanacetum cinerariifolium]